MLKISAVYLIGKAEIPIHYTTWGQVEQALLIKPNVTSDYTFLPMLNILMASVPIVVVTDKKL